MNILLSESEKFFKWLREKKNVSNIDLIQATEMFYDEFKRQNERPDVISAEFHEDLAELINKYAKKGLEKEILIHRMFYMTESCVFS